MKERKHLYTAWLRGNESVAELARRFGVSRKTAYQGLKRGMDGDESFADRSRRPKRSPDPAGRKVIHSPLEK